VTTLLRLRSRASSGPETPSLPTRFHEEPNVYFHEAYGVSEPACALIHLVLLLLHTRATVGLTLSFWGGVFPRVFGCKLKTQVFC
jgi:hypothetical protein